MFLIKFFKSCQQSGNDVIFVVEIYLEKKIDQQLSTSIKKDTSMLLQIVSSTHKNLTQCIIITKKKKKEKKKNLKVLKKTFNSMYFNVTVFL